MVVYLLVMIRMMLFGLVVMVVRMVVCSSVDRNLVIGESNLFVVILSYISFLVFIFLVWLVRVLSLLWFSLLVLFGIWMFLMVLVLVNVLNLVVVKIDVSSVSFMLKCRLGLLMLKRFIVLC